MRKTISVLAAVLALMLTACGAKKNDTPTPVVIPSTQAPASQASTTKAPATKAPTTKAPATKAPTEDAETTGAANDVTALIAEAVELREQVEYYFRQHAMDPLDYRRFVSYLDFESEENQGDAHRFDISIAVVKEMMEGQIKNYKWAIEKRDSEYAAYAAKAVPFAADIRMGALGLKYCEKSEDALIKDALYVYMKDNTADHCTADVMNLSIYPVKMEVNDDGTVTTTFDLEISFYFTQGMYFLNLDDQSYYDNGIWYAYGIFDEASGELLFNDYFEPRTTGIMYNGQTVEIKVEPVENSQKRGWATDVQYNYGAKIMITAPEGYKGAFFAILPVTEYADPSYNVEDYAADALLFAKMYR